MACIPACPLELESGAQEKEETSRKGCGGYGTTILKMPLDAEILLPPGHRLNPCPLRMALFSTGNAPAGVARDVAEEAISLVE